jgi:hypothetical protein
MTQRRPHAPPASGPAILEPAPHDVREIGRATHRVIAHLVDEGHRAPSGDDIRTTVLSEPAAGLPHVYGLAARRRISAAVSLYFRHFVPGPHWRFLGAELRVPGACLDLVFSHGREGVLADELKTGLAAADGQDQGLEGQLVRALSGGSAMFGRRFRGIRVLLLAAPLRSFVALPSGDRVPLERGKPL